MSSIPIADPNSGDGVKMIGCNHLHEPSESPSRPVVSHSRPVLGSSRNGDIDDQNVGPHAPLSRAAALPSGEGTRGEEATTPESSWAAGDGAPDQPPIFHRVREVRVLQGVSLRTMARRLGVDVKTCRELEAPSTNLTLAELRAIQQALDVPLGDLLIDRDSLARPVEERAKMVKVMKTAVSLREMKAPIRVHRLAQMLCEQLIEIMPELREVGGWPQFGARRGKSVLGRILCEPIDTSNLRINDGD